MQSSVVPHTVGTSRSLLVTAPGRSTHIARPHILYPQPVTSSSASSISSISSSPVSEAPAALRGCRAVCRSSRYSVRPPAPEEQEHVGVVIVDHGSRKKSSNDMLIEFAQLYQEVSGARVVEPAHMEIAEPTIEQAIGKCVSQGSKVVVVAPYFLSRGRHIQEDIPALVKAAQEKYPDVKCIIADPIGVDPMMAHLIANRVQSALDSKATSVEVAA